MKKIKSYIIAITIFLMPLFFLPITHEFYNTNKVALLTVASTLLITLTVLQITWSQKIYWRMGSLRILLILVLLVTAILTTTLLRTINPAQAIQSYIFGFFLILQLTIFTWHIAEKDNELDIYKIIMASGLFIAIVTSLLSLRPFQYINLPKTFQFLNDANMTPLGSLPELYFFLGFVSLLFIFKIVQIRKQTRRLNGGMGVGLILCIVALALSIQTAKPSTYFAAPFDLSIKAALKTMKDPVSFLMGSGLNNISTVFTQVKDQSYNNSPYWTQGSFDLASSALIHIFIESGLISVLIISFIFFFSFKHIQKTASVNKLTHTWLLIYLIVAYFLTPASFMLFFITYVIVGLIISEGQLRHRKSTFLSVVFIALAIGIWIIVYNFSMRYRAEILMKQSLDAIATNNLQKFYLKQVEASIQNPHIERFHLSLSQTSLFIAKEVSNQSNPNQTLLTKAVQQAIQEAQYAIRLNSKRAQNWENLAIIYQNILNLQDAGKWGIAAYQRAIVLDPQNVRYRLQLGGLYYALKQYENAVKSFQEASLLKPDLAIAHYNLAHAYYQAGKNGDALAAMDHVLNLIQDKSSSEYKKILSEKEKMASGEVRSQPATVIQ